MHNALRAHENPALDVSLWLGRKLGLPVFVYQGLSERYKFASDRHHAFILQGASDVHSQLARRGIGSALHVERPGHRGPWLRELAQRAAVVVTEDMPVDPIPTWVSRIVARSNTPVWLVDTGCVIPMSRFDRPHVRAFEFREAILPELDKRLATSWAEQPDPLERYVPGDLPFEPIDPATIDLRQLIGACDIDHSIGPVPHTLGGSTAGYARWERFRRDRLRRYADDRNDALRPGVSRMSAYLHYGMVSPLRIARETAAIPGPGAAKYLDELIIWRELAFHFCRHRTDHDSLSAIPAWAQNSLRDHQTDVRPAVLDWETLARGRTGDALWDAAQTSLRVQGELHNNVRMTWGKAFLNWTSVADDAFRLAIDLNHRYALDGRDPASYGGLLWCFGQFDRPHSPERPILGVVRARPTDQHATRLDPERYRRLVETPWREPMPRVAVIGAGIAGLTAARVLTDHRFPVTVFDKGRSPGGRASSRRIESNLSFDHGVQYFTAKSELFARHVASWAHQGVVAEWTGRFVDWRQGSLHPAASESRYVGVPRMSALAAHLAKDATVTVSVQITAMKHSTGTWMLTDATGAAHGPFDEVVVTLPAPQAAFLLSDHPFSEEARRQKMTPCWAVLAAYPTSVDCPWDAARLDDDILGWVARNSSKPGRPREDDCWVLHATPSWSAEHIDDSPETVARTLLARFESLVGRQSGRPTYLTAHRWRHARPTGIDHRLVLHDPGSRLLVAGDWLAGGDVEGAFRSGMAAAGCLLREVGIPAARSEPSP